MRLAVILGFVVGVGLVACGDDPEPGVEVPDSGPDAPIVDDGGADTSTDTGVDGGSMPPPLRPCRPALTGLVGWWSGDGTFADLAATPSNGATSTAPAEVAFFAGQIAGAFDIAAQSYVQIPDAAKLDITGAFSIEAWVNFAALPAMGETAVIVDKSTALGADGYGLDVTNTAGAARLRLRVGAGSLTGNVDITELETWMHVAGTWDGAMARLYIDGTARGAGAAANPVANALPLRLGGDSAAGSLLEGRIDEVMIHNRALTNAEIDDTIAYGRCKSATCASSAGTGAPPVGWWTADGIPNDRIGGHLSVQNGGFTYFTGKVGGAFDLRLAGAYLEIDDRDDLDFTATTSFSVEAWVNFEAPIGGANKRIVDKMTAAGADGWALDVQGANARFIVGDRTVLGATNLAAGTWYHLAGVYDGAALRVYVNGVQDGILAGVPTLAAGNAFPVRIGANQNGAGQVNGYVDEVAVYRRVRAAAELVAANTLGAAGYCRQTGCAPSPAGLVGWWPGDGNLADLAGGGAATSNATFAPGAIGNAFQFTAATTSFTAPHSAALEPNAITIEAWIHPVSAGGGVIVEKATAGVAQGYSFALTATGQLTFTFSDGIAAPLVVTSSGGAQGNVSVPVGQWSYVAAKYDRTSNEVLLYLNGVELGEGLNVTRNIGASGAPLAIGFTAGGMSRFPGFIDEVAVWDVAIDEAEVEEHFAAGGSGRCKQ